MFNSPARQIFKLTFYSFSFSSCCNHQTFLIRLATFKITQILSPERASERKGMSTVEWFIWMNPKRFYYRRPRHSYYTMKAKQEPVSRFDISWYTWAENFVYCLFLRFCWQFLTWLIASAELTAVFWQAKGNKSDLKKTFYILLPVVNCLLKNNLVF